MRHMRVLVFGKSGQVATALSQVQDPSLSFTFLDRAAADLTTPKSCIQHIWRSDADIVVNATAFTNVDGAETDRATAKPVNTDAPFEMAQACVARDMPFLHISTDFVFDGSSTTPYRPTDATNPISHYGLTKRDGEDAIRATLVRHVILRTAWVFSAHGQNFVKAMLSLGQKHQTLRVVADQIGGPTHAGAIAEAIGVIIKNLVQGHPGGTFHFTGAPDISRATFARKIFELAEMPVDIADIPSSDYPTPAQRPLNSRLDCQTTWDAFKLSPPDWIADLKATLKSLEQGQTR